MSEERRICAAKPIKPISRPLGLATQPLELTARPADDIEIDPLQGRTQLRDRKSTRLNSSHVSISYAVFCLKKKNRAPGSSALTSPPLCEHPFRDLCDVGG